MIYEHSEDGKEWKEVVCVPNYTLQPLTRAGEFMAIKANGRILFWVWAEMRHNYATQGLIFSCTPVKRWKQKRGHMVERMKGIYKHKLKKSYL